MKTQHKPGMLVKFVNSGTADFGMIEGVITRADGTSYLLKDRGEVASKEIIAVYREVKPRTGQVKKAKAGTAKKKAPEATSAT